MAEVTLAAPCSADRPCPDADSDGVPDPEDLCPDDPAGTPDGCAIPDRDADGVPDPDDPCPDQAESDNAFQTDGCPEELPPHVVAALAPYRYTVGEIDAIARTGTLGPRLRAALDRLAAVLLEDPALRIELQFHRDPGEPHIAFWRNRSGVLPNAAKLYLVERHRIDEGRIVPVNIGPDMPMVSNRSEAGRAKNRRLAFVLIE
ncbi:MAG: hypothetical protein R3B09_30970 [Nannocystaceae bacterium]